MKTNISVSRFIDSLRNEQSNYIIAVIMICGLSILLIISIVMNGYAITSLILTSRQEIAKVADLHIAAKSDNAMMNSATASRWDFFGSSSVSGAAPSNFALLGVEFTADEPAHAKAIISTNSGDGELYSVGDKLGPGTIVDRIEENDVILLHNGVRQVLSLTWEGESDIRNQQNEAPGQNVAPNYNMMIQQMKRYHFRPGFPMGKFLPGE